MTGDYLLQGEEVLVCGDYRLGAVVRRTVRSIIYEAEYAGESAERKALRAVIKIREADEQEADALVSRWRRATELDHPNLQKVYDAGTCRLEDNPIAYAVLERADESLAGVISDRALSRKEILELLGPAVAALGYLHKKGYAHGSVKPANVLAAGNELKISSDSAIPVDQGGSQPADVYALGVLIVQALTQKMPEQVDPADYGLTSDTDTIADIVRHCLERDPGRRWTIEQVAQRLEGPLPKPVPRQTVIEVPRARIDEWKAASTTLPNTAAEPDEETGSHGIPKWILVGIAAVLVVVGLTWAMRSQTASQPAQPDPPVAHAVPHENAAPETEPPPPPVQKPSPLGDKRPAVVSKAPAVVPKPPAVAPKPAASAAEPTPSPAPEGDRRAQGWSVIVAAYTAKEAAEKRAQDMAKKFPRFEITVQQQQSDRASYLVVLGQNLSEDRADALKDRALRSGLPRDTYIKRITPAN